MYSSILQGGSGQNPLCVPGVKGVDSCCTDMVERERVCVCVCLSPFDVLLLEGYRLGLGLRA